MLGRKVDASLVNPFGFKDSLWVGEPRVARGAQPWAGALANAVGVQETRRRPPADAGGSDSDVGHPLTQVVLTSASRMRRSRTVGLRA